MELLIPGLILVALMVYASTRIKRSAAAAFEPETIETDDFIIQKPEGFLNVIGGDPQYAFEAYSKDFGVDADKTKLATANLRIAPAVSIEAAVDDIKNGDAEVVSDVSEVVGDHHYRVVETRRNEDDVEFRTFYKLAEKNGGLYEFTIDVLAEADDDFLRKVEALVASFEIK
jgi:hypothetical protein